MITFTRLGKYGRLGNQLFQIASTIGIANKNKTTYSFPEWEYSKYLKIDLPILDLKVNYSLSHNDFCYKDILINTHGVTDIFGYLQSYKFFKNINANEIFELKEDFLSYRNYYDMSNSVSIHVRRTDYLENKHVYPILSIDYYKKALEELKKKEVEISKVYVFSDDIDWCKSNFDFIENIFFISEYNEFIELHMMSECSHNIISNSTFSWWASFLNKNDAKKIICPNTWFNKCDEIKNFVYDDLIPNEWIKIKI